MQFGRCQETAGSAISGYLTPWTDSDGNDSESKDRSEACSAYAHLRSYSFRFSAKFIPNLHQHPLLSPLHLTVMAVSTCLSLALAIS